jgi:hypothetical protein
MKKKLIFSAMSVILLALGLALVGCSPDNPGGGKIDWHRTYEDDDEFITFTGTSISGKYSISNVSIGETRTIKDDGDTIIWAYVFKDENTKIGIIYRSTWTMGSSYSETSYYLYLGKNRWENSGGADQSAIRDDGCDVTDMSNDYSFRGSYDED